MWVNPVRSPSARSAAGRDRPDAVVLGPACLARQEHPPLDPRVAQHLQRRGQVARDRVPDDLPVRHHAVVGALLAGEELLEQRGPVRRWAGRVSSHTAQLFGVVEAERALGPGARGRLDHQREPGLGGEARPPRPRSRPAGAARTARPPPAAPTSSAPCRGSCARSPRPCPGCPAARGPARAAPAAARAPRRAAAPGRGGWPSAPQRGGDLPGVERVVDPPVRGQPAPQPIGDAALGVAGDERQLGVRQPGRRADEPHRRVEQVGRDERGDHHARGRYPGCARAQSGPGGRAGPG